MTIANEPVEELDPDTLREVPQEEAEQLVDEPVDDESAEVGDEPQYVLNKNEGIDTLHRNPREECNLDDAEGRVTIDALTAKAMKAGGHVRLCKHCKP